MLLTLQRRRYGELGGPYPLKAVCVPLFRFTLDTVFGISHNEKTTDNDEEGKITFKHDCLLRFSRFCAKMLATNCCI